MNRKEVYERIKKLNAAEAIKKAFGKNFTLVKIAELTIFLDKLEKKSTKKVEKKTQPKKAEKKASCNCKKKVTKNKPTKVTKESDDCKCKSVTKAMIALITTLSANKVINTSEAEDIIDLL